MVELMQTSNNTMQQSFAGDVYNTAVYLKRGFNNVETHIVTAVGKDKLSDEMRRRFSEEHVNTDFVFIDPDKVPGLYLIQTDEQGERSFTYWRENSAARKAMNFINDDVVSQMSKGDLFFFSGISLAVIEPELRALFWQCLTQLKAAGVQIAFDPNYRARMWANAEEAKTQFEQAFELSDIVLPGIDDFSQLYQLTTFEQVQDFCQRFNINELVIKNGPDGVISIVNGVVERFVIEPVKNVVDTTSAGDSFNGFYLGSRLNGHDVAESVVLASESAAFVIQHKGAIVPRNVFNQFLQQMPQKSLSPID